MYYNNKLLTIVPETHSGEIIGNYEGDDVVRASYCYLHGALEHRNGYDIFSLVKSELLSEHIDENWVSQSFPEGIYECICFGEPCTFFCWKPLGDKLHGLVVFDEDKDAFEDAQNKYLEKACSI